MSVHERIFAGRCATASADKQCISSPFVRWVVGAIIYKQSEQTALVYYNCMDSVCLFLLFPSVFRFPCRNTFWSVNCGYMSSVHGCHAYIIPWHCMHVHTTRMY